MIPRTLEISARNDPDNTVASDSGIVDLDIARGRETGSDHEVTISRTGFGSPFQLRV